MLRAIGIEQRKNRILAPPALRKLLATIGKGVVLRVEIIGPLLAVNVGMQAR